MNGGDEWLGECHDRIVPVFPYMIYVLSRVIFSPGAVLSCNLHVREQVVTCTEVRALSIEYNGLNGVALFERCERALHFVHHLHTDWISLFGNGERYLRHSLVRHLDLYRFVVRHIVRHIVRRSPWPRCFPTAV